MLPECVPCISSHLGLECVLWEFFESLFTIIILAFEASDVGFYLMYAVAPGACCKGKMRMRTEKC